MRIWSWCRPCSASSDVRGRVVVDHTDTHVATSSGFCLAGTALTFCAALGTGGSDRIERLDEAEAGLDQAHNKGAG